MPTFCGQCGSSVSEQVKFCQSCGAKIEPSPVSSASAVESESGSSQWAQSFAASRTEDRRAGENTPLLIGAAIANFMMAALLSVFVLLQLGLGEALSNKQLSYTGYWNLIAVGFYVAVGAGILMRKDWAWSWGIGTNALNLIIGLVQVTQGGLLNVFMLPLELFILIALYTTKSAERFKASAYSGVQFDAGKQGGGLEISHSSVDPAPFAVSTLPTSAVGKSKYGIGGGVVLAALLAWAYASPWIALKDFQQALSQGDEASISSYVDFDKFRASLKLEVAKLIEKEAGKRGASSNAERFGVKVFGGALTDALIDQLVTAKSLALAFRGDGSSEATNGASPLEKLRSSLASTGSTQNVSIGYEGVSRFVVTTNVPDLPFTSVKLVFSRSGLVSWLLSGVEFVSDASPTTTSNGKPDDVDVREEGGVSEEQAAVNRANNPFWLKDPDIDARNVSSAISAALQRYRETGIAGVEAISEQCWAPLDEVEFVGTDGSAWYQLFERCASMDLTGYTLDKTLSTSDYFKREAVWARIEENDKITADEDRVQSLEKMVVEAVANALR